MIANKVKLKLGTGAIRIDPTFKAVDYSIVKWAVALAKHQAKARWRNLDNSESYGLFTVDPDGRAFFAPRKAGSFVVNCEVYYRDDVTTVWQTIDQDLTITVEELGDGNCTCEVKISARAIPAVDTTKGG